MRDPFQKNNNGDESSVKLKSSTDGISNGNLLNPKVKSLTFTGEKIVNKINGSSHRNVNGKVISGVNGKNFSNFNDNSFRFTIEVPKNVVIKVVDILGIEAATLVDDLRTPGHYVVTLDKGKNNPGLYYYKLYTEIEDKNVDNYLTLHDKPGKKYELIEEKEITLL